MENPSQNNQNLDMPSSYPATPHSVAPVSKAKQSASLVVIGSIVLAIAGVGFGIFGMVSGSIQTNDLKRQLVEKNEQIANLMSDMQNPETGEVDNPATVPNAFTAKNLLMDNRNQFVNIGDDAAIIVDLSSGSTWFSINLHKQLGGPIYYPGDADDIPNESPTTISGSIDYDAIGGSGRVSFQITNIDANRVVDVMMSGFGNAVGDETVFLLMDDGTVEYMPIAKAVANGEYKSYGKLPGLTNIVRLRANTGWTYGLYGSGVNAIAQSADGKVYFLYDVIRETGNYN